MQHVFEVRGPVARLFTYIHYIHRLLDMLYAVRIYGHHFPRKAEPPSGRCPMKHTYSYTCNRKHENQETKTLDPGRRSVRGRPRYEVHRSIHRDEICFNLHRALGSFQLLLPRLAALFEGTSTYVRTRFVFAGAPRERHRRQQSCPAAYRRRGSSCQSAAAVAETESLRGSVRAQVPRLPSARSGREIATWPPACARGC